MTACDCAFIKGQIELAKCISIDTFLSGWWPKKKFMTMLKLYFEGDKEVGKRTRIGLVGSELYR